MERKTFFADVILPLALPDTYTYRIPKEFNEAIKEGKRVVVPFRSNKLYTALVERVHEEVPKHYQARYIEAVLDDEPIVHRKQVELWKWIASYYLCTLGEVMNAALPAGLKLNSETKIVLSPLEPDDSIELTPDEKLIVDVLGSRNSLLIEEVSSLLQRKTIYPLIKSLIEKKVVLIHEEIKEKYKPKTETRISLAAVITDEEELKKAFAKVEKFPKQLELLMSFIHLSKHYSEDRQAVKKSELLNQSGKTNAVLNTLIKKNILEIELHEANRLEDFYASEFTRKLNEHQQKAFEKIKEGSKDKQVTLLHGVTSSGKTEIYVQLIEETIRKGKQVLYLLPEIALTTQIINRLRKYFGNKVGIYHSRFSQNEKVEVWKKVFANSTGALEDHSVILGARSALFLPFDNLGLIIVDEEHDSSYKQYDPAPRYNARDTAIYLGGIHNAPVLLGSATPSIETYFNARQGKYGYAALMERYGGVEMPKILVADVKEDTRRKMMKSHFSPLLIDHIKEAMDNKEQVILFQNRRGFASFLQCVTCGHVPHCIQCDVSLTYHKGAHLLKCHYCGYSMTSPKTCVACGSHELKMLGFGTEKIEEELAIFFPTARIARMDLDTTRSKFAYQHIINDFEEQNIDILVGTQMVTKGLDFEHVSLVGILSADSMLNFPDFRSHERSYQLMAQVSGRAGRKNKRGKVLIQTFSPKHAIIEQVIKNDFEGMYNMQLKDRKSFHYPPFCRLISITLKYKDADLLNEASQYFADLLKEQFGKRILGPEFPLVPRIRNFYLKQMLLKLEKELSVSKAKLKLKELVIQLKQMPEYKNVQVVLDVDPM